MTHDQPGDPRVGCTMGDLFVRAIQRGGSRVALIEGSRTLNFDELGDRVARLAQAMAGSGLQPGDAIAQLSRNKLDAVCVIGAAFILGLRYTPLHPLGSASDQAFVIEDAEIDCLVIDEENFADRAEILARVLGGKRLLFSHGSATFGCSIRDLEEAAQGAPLRSRARADGIALVAYTGGTTGRPKGVVHRHRSLVANTLIAMAEWEWRHPERFLAVTPISHAAFLFTLPVLLKGGAIVLSDGFSPQGFATAVRDLGVTSTFLVPTMIYDLLDSSSLDMADLTSLSLIIYGAAPIAPDRLAEALTRFGPRFAQLYGQTETPNTVTMLFKGDHQLSRPDRLGSCGAPLTGIDVQLLDDAGLPVDQGAVGEICVRGPLVMDGYWNRPDETGEVLRDGWLRTGDLARADERGYLTIVDRRKDMVISGGFNVYPKEVEDALASHPAVAQSCVFGLPDPKWGEAVAALVVLRSAAAASEADLMAHVRSTKGAVNTPKRVGLVPRIPTTALGKMDKAAARAVLLELDPSETER